MTTAYDNSIKNQISSSLYSTGSRKWKTVKQYTAIEKNTIVTDDVLFYLQLDAPPSCRPKAKYCDITGLPAKYTDPKTGLNYHSADVFKYIETLSHASVQNYLSLRGKAVELK